jgi:general secretion pathway protein C
MSKRIGIIMLILIWVVSLPCYAAQADNSRFLLSRYRLIGTIVKSDASQSLAIIRDLTSKKDTLYKIGQVLEGFYIVKIKRAEVQLLREGKLISLSLPLGGGAEFITVVSDTERIVNRTALNERYNNLNELFKAGLVFPQIEDGKIEGLRIIHIEDKAIAQAAGIQEGDIVLSVNGKKLASIQQVLDLYNAARGQPQLKVKIKRNNNIYEYTYYMNWEAKALSGALKDASNN